MSTWPKRRLSCMSPAAREALAEVAAILRYRRTIARDRRVPFEEPPAHLATQILPSLMWTLGVAWQDRPWIVIGMGLPGALYILYSMYHWFRWIAHGL